METKFNKFWDSILGELPAAFTNDEVAVLRSFCALAYTEGSIDSLKEAKETLIKHVTKNFNNEN